MNTDTDLSLEINSLRLIIVASQCISLELFGFILLFQVNISVPFIPIIIHNDFISREVFWSDFIFIISTGVVLDKTVYCATK